MQFIKGGFKCCWEQWVNGFDEPPLSPLLSSTLAEVGNSANRWRLPTIRAVREGNWLLGCSSYDVARVWQRSLEDEGIDTIDWPARFPNRIPIEYIGASWINSFGGFQTHPGQSRSSPTPWLRSESKSIDLETICRLIISMPRRCWACIQAREVHARYWCVLSIWLNGRIFGTNPYLDYHFVFQHDFGNLSSNGYSPFTLANFVQICYR